MLRRTFVALAGVVLLPACGKQEATPEAQVRSVLARYGQATARKDYQELCDVLITPALAKGPEEVGLPCELAFQRGLGAVRKPTLRVLGVTVKGARATARVRTGAEGQAPSTDLVRLERLDGEWRIADLG